MVRLGRVMWCNNFEKQNSCDGKEKQNEYYEKYYFFLQNTYSYTFAKLWKASISFVLCVRHAISPSAGRKQQLSTTWRIFMKLYIWICLETRWRKFKSHENRTGKTVHYMKTTTYFWSYLTQFLLEWEMFQTNIVEAIIHTHYVFNKVYLISCRLWDHVDNYCKAGRRQYGAYVLHAW
jgi:hypothetical protein